ncbi:hypothetical protein BGZ65_008719, partial [Modicella reniformis]
MEISDSKSTSKSSTSTTPKMFRFEGSISSETYKTTKSFDLAGVNILNRKPLDTRTALDKLQRRRETHNRVERKRRDCINQLIDDLTRLLPPKHLEEVTSKCHRVNVLRGAVAHIKFLSEQNSLLTKSLDAAKAEGFNVSIDLTTTAKEASEAAERSTSPESDTMVMDVDTIESVKQEDGEDDNDNEQLARAENTSSRSSSPSVTSTSSQSTSPRLTPSKAMGLPPVIVTNSPSLSTLKESSRPQSQSKETLVPPPISIITTPAEPHNTGSQHQRSNSMSDCASPSSSFSTSPMFPPSQYMAPTKPSSTAFPLTPVSPSPSTTQNPFSSSTSPSESHQGSGKVQQLSPFSQHRPSSSPSLPPISSLANLQLQSPSAEMGSHSPADSRLQDHQTSPSLRPTNCSSSPSPNSKLTSQRSGPTLPPLKIPPQHHLHPYSQGGHDSSKPSQRNSLTPSSHQTSPREQPPVSPFMASHSLSPAGTSAYPPPHPGHYMPGSLSPLVYPHGYPYPYPYHPSYAYPHPHGPPPPHHPHHQPPTHTPPQQSSSAAAAPTQPAPIFIQEEPWIVQKKRGTSNAAGKNPSSSKQASNKKNQEKEVDQLTEEPPMSPTSSVISSASNYRKRPSQKGSLADSEDTTKRAKQQTLDVDLEG